MACLICGSARSRTVWRRDSKRIEKCLECELVFVAERPSEADLLNLYNGDALLKFDLHPGSSDESVVPAWKNEEYVRLLDSIARLGVRGGKLLDVGCFSGIFLGNAKRRDFSVVGVEPNRDACVRVRDVLGFDVVHGSLTSARFAPGTFSVVSLLDVIEHLSDPVVELEEVFRILRPGGVLVITTPNVEGLPQRVVGAKRFLFRQDWCPIDGVPWHLYGFTRSTLRRCVEKAGFQFRSVEWLKPSLLSTNDGAGSSPAKRFQLRLVGEASRLLRMSDRIALFAQKGSGEDSAPS
jgi:SAM-dependent methyltransferase